MSVVKRILIVVSLVAVTVFVGSLVFDVSNSIDKNVYATGIEVVNVPRELELVFGNAILFEENPFKLTPNNCDSEIEVDILDYMMRPTDMGNYSNGVFRADKIATFFIKFKVKNKNGNYLYDLLKVKVVDKLEASGGWVNCFENSISTTYGETVDLSDFASAVNTKESLVYFLGGKQIDSNFVSKNLGNNKIYAGIREDKYIKCVDISIYVNETNDYSLSVYDKFNNPIFDGDTIEVALKDGYLMLCYEVLGKRSQSIDVVSSNTNCVAVLSCSAPMITLKLNSKGETMLILSGDNGAFNIKIVVK